MTIRSAIEWRGLVPDKAISKRQLNKVVQKGNETWVQTWHRKYVKLHFGPRASRRYGYYVRSVAHGLRKARKLGIPAPGRMSKAARAEFARRVNRDHPMEFNGRAKALAVTTIRIQSSFKRATGRFPGAVFGAIALNSAKGDPGKPVELVRLLPREEKDLARVHEQTVAGGLNRLTDRKRTTF